MQEWRHNTPWLLPLQVWPSESRSPLVLLWIPAGSDWGRPHTDLDPELCPTPQSGLYWPVLSGADMRTSSPSSPLRRPGPGTCSHGTRGSNRPASTCWSFRGDGQKNVSLRPGTTRSITSGWAFHNKRKERSSDGPFRQSRARRPELHGKDSTSDKTAKNWWTEEQVLLWAHISVLNREDESMKEI